MKLIDTELDNLIKSGIKSYLDIATQIYINQISQTTGIQNSSASEINDLFREKIRFNMLNKKEALKIARKHAIKKIGKINENLTYSQEQNGEFVFTFFSNLDHDTEVTVWVNINGDIVKDDYIEV